VQLEYQSDPNPHEFEILARYWKDRVVSVIVYETDYTLMVTPDDQDLLGMAKLSELRKIVLEKGDISKDGLTAISQLEKLDSLTIQGDTLTDDAMTVIPKFQNLKYLKVGSPKVTAKGLTEICKNRDLEHLVLNVPNMEAQGFSALKSMPNLKMVELFGAHTDEEVARLRNLVSELQSSFPTVPFVMPTDE
jgi:hypothetical protein